MISGICKALADYSVSQGLLPRRDTLWAINTLMDLLGCEDFDPAEPSPQVPLWELLGTLAEDAVRRGICPDTGKARETLMCRLLGVLTPRPSAVEERFWTLWKCDPVSATDYFHALGAASGYIREDLAAKNPRWETKTEFGDLEITVNLAKPEKDPRDIAAALTRTEEGVPACLLCAENEGYGGRPGFPARQNHRLISLTLGWEPWALQYSPYVYYPEHCIVLNRKHTPMHIDRVTFRNLLEFVSLFPHYFAGSNADLPIVGGSILSHDHYQGGRHVFAMEKAEVEIPFGVPGFWDVSCGVVRWPMTCLRLRGPEPDRLAELAGRILDSWRVYSDPELSLLAETDGVPHHTITPIARRRGLDYELDLVLRSNLTTPDYPAGLYHPHPELHHIKKENIGLIEVMGLAVLPGRLQSEMAALIPAMLSGSLDPDDPVIGKHVPWARGILAARKDFSARNAEEILREETGRAFSQVLSQCAVFGRDEKGRAGLSRFFAAVSAGQA